MPGKKQMPDWVQKHKKKGIEIERKGNNYYARRIGSVWDPSKGRSQKVTLEYLGKVTPEGIIPSIRKQKTEIGGILEAGHISFLKRFIDNISEPLIEIFPKDWQNILSSACIKLCYQESFSRMKIRHDTSWSRRLWPGAALSKNSITEFLPRIGRQWKAQREFFKEISKDEKSDL